MSRASSLGILIIVVALQCSLKKLLKKPEQLFSKFLVFSQKLECRMYQNVDFFLKLYMGQGCCIYCTHLKLNLKKCWLQVIFLNGKLFNSPLAVFKSQTSFHWSVHGSEGFFYHLVFPMSNTDAHPLLTTC